MTTGGNRVVDPAQSIPPPLPDNPDRQSDPLAAEPDVYTAYWQARSGFFSQTAKPPLDRHDPVRHGNP